MRRNRILASAMASLLILCATGSSLIWNFNQWPIEQDALSSLSRTHSEEDVLRLLGEPTSRFAHTDEGGRSYVEFVYSKPMVWPIVYVRFDPAGNFAGYHGDY